MDAEREWRRDVADGFAEEVVARLGALAGAVADERREEAWQLAHGIRGVAATVHADALAQAAARLCAWARGADEDAAALVAEIDREVRVTAARLETLAREGANS